MTASYAGIIRRSCSAIIDLLLISIIILLLSPFIISLLIYTIFSGGELSILLSGLIFSIIFMIPLLYFLWSWKKHNATIGQRMLNLKLLNQDLNNNIKITQLLLRSIIFTASTMHIYMNFHLNNSVKLNNNTIYESNSLISDSINTELLSFILLLFNLVIMLYSEKRAAIQGYTQ